MGEKLTGGGKWTAEQDVGGRLGFHFFFVFFAKLQIILDVSLVSEHIQKTESSLFELHLMRFGSKQIMASTYIIHPIPLES